MTDGKQISVAELLARNGQENGGQNGGGRRRRAGKNGGVSVASLTGEFPVVQQPVEDPPPAAPVQPTPPPPVAPPPAPQSVVPPQQPVAPHQPVAPQQPALFQRSQPAPPQQVVRQPTVPPPGMPVPQQLAQPVFMPQQLAQPTFMPQQPVGAPQFPIQPPAAPPMVGPTAPAQQQYSFGDPSAVAATPAPAVETPQAKPTKRRTRAERRAAEEQAEREAAEAAASQTSHARPDAADAAVDQPTYSLAQDFPTMVNRPPASGMVPPVPTGMVPPVHNTLAPPAMGQFGLAPAPPPSPMIDSTPTVLEPGSIPGLAPAAFDQSSQTYAPPNDAEATALHPVVVDKPARQSKLRNFPLGRFGAAGQRTDDAPTEIRQPDPKPAKGVDKTEPPQQAAPPQPVDDATSVWPAPAIGVGGARSLTDETPAGPAAAVDSGRATAEPKVRKDKPRKPKKQPQRAAAAAAAAAMDFPTTVWNPSNQESQLLANPALADELLREDAPPLLAGPSLAGELMRGAPEEPFEPTEHYHNPQPDDQPTDVDHPFFSRGPGVDFVEQREIDEVDEPAEDPEKIKRAWWIQVGQWLAAGVSGVLLFKGFEVLWVHLAMVALALAVTVILGLVALVRILRRTDDVLSLAIAVVVGVFVTLGPLAFTLRTG